MVTVPQYGFQFTYTRRILFSHAATSNRPINLSPLPVLSHFFTIQTTVEEIVRWISRKKTRDLFCSLFTHVSLLQLTEWRPNQTFSRLFISLLRVDHTEMLNKLRLQTWQNNACWKKKTLINDLRYTCQLSRFSRESPSFSLNLPVSRNAFWVIFGGYSWTLSLMTFSQCKDF